jgi:homoserine O-acetyltransferase/O-succinyltransferase
MSNVEPLTSIARAGKRSPAHPRERTSREGILEIAGAITLHHGGTLTDLRLAWRLTGPKGAPVVCALGGISAHRRVCDTDDPREGWWAEIAGPGRALDSQRYRILGFDFIGGTGESTAPAPGAAFPAISSYDQADALLRILNHLGIKSLRAIAGGSYGGMVALAFAERYPRRVARLIVIGASDRAHPMSTAWRSIERRIIRFGIECGRPEPAVELARALAMTTYRSGEEFAARFAGEPSPEADALVFPVERYLMARGRDYARRYRPESFLCLSESIDLHRVDAARITVPTSAVAIREDRLVPLADVRAMVARLPAGALHEIPSVYGHDAFLKESDLLRAVFEAALEERA